MNDADCQKHDIQWSSKEIGTDCPACRAEAERDEWKNAYFALEFDEHTGECLLGCGGDSAIGHEDDCVFIATMPEPKTVKTAKRMT